MKMNIIRISWASLLALLLGGCAVFQPSARNEKAYADSLGEFRLYDEAQVPHITAWWLSFNDPQLNDLMTEALAQNLSLQQARARLRQAWLVAEKQASARRISAEASAGAGVSEERRETEEGSTNISAENYSLGLAAAYELDLWGRLASLDKAAELDAKASEADRNIMAGTVASEVALTYFNILWQRETLDIINDQLETARKNLELMELRFRNSQATALDVLQRRESVAQIEAMIPPARANEESLILQLSILLGKPPTDSVKVKGRRLPPLPPQPDAGLPADLLARRPDVLRAGLRLRSADWTLSAARADRLPSIRLSASAKYASSDTSALFDNWIASLAASLTGPILDGGRRRAEVQRVREVVAERLAAYRETVISAVGEIQEVMIRESGQTEYLKALERQLAASLATREEALERYKKGQENYLTVLSAENGAQQVQRQISLAAHDRLAHRVKLYRALGGDWNAILDETSSTNERKNHE